MASFGGYVNVRPFPPVYLNKHVVHLRFGKKKEERQLVSYDKLQRVDSLEFMRFFLKDRNSLNRALVKTVYNVNNLISNIL